MLARDAFVTAILGAGEAPAAPTDDSAGEFAGLPRTARVDFARHLLACAGFGPGEAVPTAATLTLLPDDPGARGLPPRLLRWQPDPDAGRTYHALLVELDHGARELLADDGLARERREGRVEDAVHRVIGSLLRGFERAGGAAQHRTLVVVSVLDDVRPADADRRWRPSHLVCFGTRWVPRAEREGEGRAPASARPAIFAIREEVRFWADEARAGEHLRALYDRHISRLGRRLDWQDAFMRERERELLAELRHAWARRTTDVQRTLLALLDALADGHGLHPRRNSHVLVADLPATHDLGATEAEALAPGFHNDVEAARLLRADDRRLLGYLVIDRGEYDALAARLAAGNRHHNVLVVSHDAGLVFDLWQGTRRLRARLVDGDDRVISLLSRLFVVDRGAAPRPQQLAGELARRAVKLRTLAARRLAAERERGAGELLTLRAAFASLARLDDDAFVDAYAQTLAYGLLSARWLSHAGRASFTRAEVPRLLPTTSPFLAALFGELVGARLDASLDWLVDDLVDLLARTAVREVFAGDEDPSIHFYEDFLDAYDPRLRKRRGVYYTPDELVAYVVDTAHTALQERFGLRLGLADTTTWGELARARGIPVPEDISPGEPFVQLLDPSTGTGTFLLRAIAVIHATMLAEYAARGWDAAKRRERWRAYVRDSLLPRVYGLEVMVAPYVVCHLRLGLALARTGFVFGRGKQRGDERLRVYLTDTLQPGDAEVAAEARDAAWAKHGAPISVLVGNPPYEREPAGSDGARRGGWIVDGWDGWRDGRPPLEDFAAPTRRAGAGAHLKNIYNLYVYFWRWATWRVFDRHGAPGIVSLITASSYLRGPGFAGMREELRRAADSIHVLDLEGDQRGARPTENVFDITIPVCVGTLIAERPDRSTPARAHYLRLTGSRDDKLAACARAGSLARVRWTDAPAGWSSVLLAAEPAGFLRWPSLLHVFPWQQSGCKAGRTWVIGETAALLEARLRRLLRAAPGERTALFKNSPTGQKADHAPVRLPPAGGADVAIVDAPSRAPLPSIERFGFRSFDRRWIVADSRFLDRAGPPNWYVRGPSQVYLTSLLSGAIGPGPAATVSAHVPDLHHFCGRGGKDIVPLWRDPGATRPNIAAGLLAALTAAHGRPPRPEDVLAYSYAVLANPSYVRRFEGLLQVPGPRLPVTKDRSLFDRGAALGRALLRWHTFGERFREDGDGFALAGDARVRVAIPARPYPARHRYDAAQRLLHVGDGRVGPVSPAVIEFSVSGLPVVHSWLGSRTARGAGRRSSPLDELRPGRWTGDLTRELLELLWVIEWTLAQFPILDAWLDEVLASELLTAAELPPPTDAERKEPKVERRDDAATRT